MALRESVTNQETPAPHLCPGKGEEVGRRTGESGTLSQAPVDMAKVLCPLLLRDLMTQRSIERRLKGDGRPVTTHRRAVGSPAGVVYPLPVKAMALRGLLGGMRVVTVSVLECRSRVIARRVTRQDIQVRARAVE